MADCTSEVISRTDLNRDRHRWPCQMSSVLELAPFDILGPHVHGDDLVIRAFWPEAERVAVVFDDEEARPMERLHDSGLFEATLSGQKLSHYQLEVTFYSGIVQLYEDPYAFEPTLSNFDAHLMAEGTHLHIYERPGAPLVAVLGVRGVRFAVWAPNAQRVSVVGLFNQRYGRRHPTCFPQSNGVWELFVPARA